MSRKVSGDLQQNDLPDGGQSLHFVRDLKEVIRPWLERSFGYHALQVNGESFGHALLKMSRINHPVLFGRGREVDVEGEGAALPFESRSLDLVILPYTLEVAENPHAVLREVERVLLPEGRLIIIGRDPWTLLEGIQLIRKKSGSVYSQSRVREWLRVLGLEAGRAEVVPMRVLHGAAFFERWPKTDRLLRLLSAHLRGSYVLLASKRESSMKPLTTPWRIHPRLVSGGMAEPAARGVKHVGD